ncbi:Putative uncharacterized protein [Taphrina deformans PYCC 5710]|uniref:Glutathione synthetase n=1 Tax=Taphrina deformans (strain PYCC 5710 / ATCC 11124 / CBS 356.35 / IMI 108563 / JCM 9778 / NBRC 8474) TaxID=1097556 RepID=R4XA36_TAPDE|nr:Putative uncharacterized protein [Taphrina deformans PYCC 5710]|eukprot:CCG82387.1 Putative uncharacterized protein [Taphrina deformans PYCC 5710]
MYAKISMDESFLTKIMEELRHVDDYMKSLWELHLEVRDRAPTTTLGLFRSDYLLHSVGDEPISIKQVEFNTISASFGSLATRTAEAHKAMCKLGAYNAYGIKPQDLPPNPALPELAKGLAKAHEFYFRDNPSAAGLVFIVQAGERNAFDQRWLEYELLERYAIPSWRIPFTEAQTYLSLETKTNKLLLQTSAEETKVEISVVYYRAGYGPEDYLSKTEWDSRKMLELSLAIKCPSIITQLAGSKKVQQVLSEPAVVENYLVPERATAVRSTFVGMHTLDKSEEGQEAIRIALGRPQKYVLKPQREGGGHNIYRSAIPDFLRSIPEDHWPGYILMELIEPPEAHNAILRTGQIFPASVVSELGIYGAILWDSKSGDVWHNEEAGHLLRTKSKDTDEGGVAAGFACIDSPWLQ